MRDPYGLDWLLVENPRGYPSTPHVARTSRSRSIHREPPLAMAPNSLHVSEQEIPHDRQQAKISPRF